MILIRIIDSSIYVLSGADKVIRGDSIVVPNSNINLTKAFNEGKHKLLLKNRVFSTIWYIEIEEGVNKKSSQGSN